MMIRISKNEDIIDILTGDIDMIKSVYYWSSADSSVEIEPIIDIEGNTMTCRIPSSELSKLATGQLMFTAVLSQEDSAFPDGEFDTIQNTGLNVWLY